MSEQHGIIVARELGVAIHSLRDINDAIGACIGRGGLLLTEADLGPTFFDLHSGLAGELLQKLVNYRVRTAIVVAQPALYGERVVELAREHRSHPLIRFLPSEEEARDWLGAAEATRGG